MAASKESGIARTDYERMHTESHTVPLPIPRWTRSDEKVRRVVAYRICITAHEPNVPTDLEDLRRLEARYIATFRNHSKEIQQHLETVKRLGGPLAYFTSLLYRRFRLGMDSPELGRQYGVMPSSVRQQINRLCRIARALFPDPADHLAWHKSATCRWVPTLKISRRYARPRALSKYEGVVVWNGARICRAYSAGKSVYEIAQSIGYPPKHGNNQVRRFLIRAGIYQKKAGPK